LFYVVVPDGITGLMLLLRIIIIEIQSGTYADFISLTGITILRDYRVLDPGYRMVAFALVVMIVFIGYFFWWWPFPLTFPNTAV
jgi:hypothetical protein